MDDSQNNVLCECGAPMATYLGQRLTLRDDGTIRLVYGVSAAQYASWVNPVLIDGAPIAEFLEVVCGGSGAVGSRVQFLGSTKAARRRHLLDRQRGQDDLAEEDRTDLVIGWGTFDYAPCWTDNEPWNDPNYSEPDNLVLVDKSRAAPGDGERWCTGGSEPVDDAPRGVGLRAVSCDVRPVRGPE